MQPISSVVKVSVVRGVRTITKAGFGTPMIISQSASFTGIRSYQDMNEVLEDFVSSAPEAVAAQRMFAAERAPRIVKIGHAASGTPSLARVLTITGGNVVSGETYGFDIGSTNWSKTANGSDAAADVLGDLADQINAGSGNGYTASQDANTLTITFNSAPDVKTIVGNNLDVAIPGGGGGTLTPVQAVQKLVDEDLDFYGVMMASRDDAAAFEVAQYIQTQRKLFVYATDDNASYDGSSTTDFMAKVKAANLTRTVALYGADATDYRDAAWLGDELPRDPGSYTEKFKTLPGVAADKLSSSQIAAIKAKNGNVYTNVGSVDIIAEGVVASGEFVDVIRFIDWQQAQIEENVFQTLVSVPKVPFNNKGIAVIEGQLRAALQAGVTVGGLTDYTVTVPDISELQKSDIAARKLKGLKFNGTLAGAIHFVDIDGTVGF